MTRDEMLNMLTKTPFRYIDPPSDWQDIGFTERPIWINSKGYGYILCDEHIGCGECDGVSKEKWEIIISKIKDNNLRLKDIEGTSLVEIVNEWLFDSLYDVQGTEEESETVSTFFKGLLDSKGVAPKRIWWMEDPEGNLEPQFYFDEQDFENARVRDWCDYSWEELEDDALVVWISRLKGLKS